MILIKTISRIEFDNSAYLLKIVSSKKIHKKKLVNQVYLLYWFINNYLTVLHQTVIRPRCEKYGQISALSLHFNENSNSTVLLVFAISVYWILQVWFKDKYRILLKKIHGIIVFQFVWTRNITKIFKNLATNWNQTPTHNLVSS